MKKKNLETLVNYILAIMFAVVVAIILLLANRYLLIYKIPDFFIGWVSCSFFILIKKTVEEQDE